MSPPSPNANLACVGAEIVKRFRGRWNGKWGMCHCPCHEDRTASLSVRVGERSLLFKCFAGCTTTDILRSLHSSNIDIPSVGTRTVQPQTNVNDRAMEVRIRGIWDKGVPIRGTVGARYFAQRGLMRCPAGLRYNPRTPLGPGRDVRFRPAVIAAVQQGLDLVAIQRLFLANNGQSLANDIENPKMTLGRPQGGAVQLQPASHLLGLAEGIETAMAAVALLKIPVWAALGSERLHQILIPRHVRRLILLPDNDCAGQLALERARRAYAYLDLELRHCWPWGGMNDWNDVLIDRSAGEGREEN